MNILEQINEHIATQEEAKRSEMHELHLILLELMPNCRLWFYDGKDEKGKTVTNPNIGYGFQNLKYANGKTREYYQIGISATSTGFSIYILGMDDDNILAQRFGKELGKASITKYCIKFKTLKDINIDMLKQALQYGIEQTSN